MTRLIKFIATFTVIFGLTCIVLFAFIHWLVMDQALNTIPWQQVLFQGSVIGGLMGAALGLMVYLRQR